MAEWEISEEIDVDEYDDDGNQAAKVTIGRTWDDLPRTVFESQLNKLWERVPPKFQEKAVVSIGRHPFGVDIVYLRPLTSDEAAIAAELKAEQEKKVIDLYGEPEGEAHEPLDLSDKPEAA